MGKNYQEIIQNKLEILTEKKAQNEKRGKMKRFTWNHEMRHWKIH